MNYQFLNSPIGKLRLVSDGKHMIAIEFEGMYGDLKDDREVDDPVLKSCASQLQEFFSGKRTRFNLPMAPQGTEFQRSVWTALEKIPHGKLRSYADIAQAIGKPKAVRAVGAANGRNPLPIVVPCHRVVGSDGSLTGFAGGLDIKRQLLLLEDSIEPDLGD